MPALSLHNIGAAEDLAAYTCLSQELSAEDSSLDSVLGVLFDGGDSTEMTTVQGLSCGRR